MNWQQTCELAAQKIAAAGAILVGAGAGMGVDSGLPDFRGQEGFWRAYPPMAKLGLSFAETANPKWFFKNPQLAWGFYGHRFNLYQKIEPHAGFSLLNRWCQEKPGGYFVFTSNVDGQFQKAGFDPNRLVECHGSIHHWQCVAACTDRIGSMNDICIEVDETDFLAQPPLPTCPDCGDLIRPNILMFEDYQWIERRTQEQVIRYNKWLKSIDNDQLVVIELGAGHAVPTVRWETESQHATLIRINPRDDDVPEGGISISTGSLVALSEIDKHYR